MEKINQIFAVYGAGGCGRGLIPFVNNNYKNEYTKIIFIDDNIKEKKIDNYEVLSFKKFIKTKKVKKNILLGISDPKIRRKIYFKIKNENINFFSLYSKNSIILDKKNISTGCSISPFTMITSNAKIGKFFHLNIYSYVEHDCEIGDFVTFAPGVKCNGNVKIHDNVFIGSGAVIKNGMPNRKIVIGENSIIGAGAVVTKTINKNTTYVGNPAIKLLKNKK